MSWDTLGPVRAQVLHRAALARQPHPEGVRKPPLALLAREFASLWRVGQGRGDAVLPARQAQTVMLLPGFGAHPKRMRPMFEALTQAGHEVHEWGLGFNFGPTPQNFAFLMHRVGALARQGRRPVVLVGWSLGGLFAREIARRQPGAVAKVITMGTPFSGDPRANNAWRAYQVITGHAVDAPPIDCAFALKPPVPTIALWSPRDGVIHPRSAKGWAHERDRAVAIRCSHLGFASDPRVIAQVLCQIDHEEELAPTSA
nr:alpha/beta fold hydrolase [Novosphingobium profundi]